MDHLPEWDALHDKAVKGISLDPLEEFIHDNEPAGLDDEYWRANFQRALYFFCSFSSTSTYMTWEFFRKWCKSHGNYDGPENCNFKTSDTECKKDNCPAWDEWRNKIKNGDTVK